MPIPLVVVVFNNVISSNSPLPSSFAAADCNSEKIPLLVGWSDAELIKTVGSLSSIVIAGSFTHFTSVYSPLDFALLHFSSSHVPVSEGLPTTYGVINAHHKFSLSHVTGNANTNLPVNFVTSVVHVALLQFPATFLAEKLLIS